MMFHAFLIDISRLSFNACKVLLSEEPSAAEYSVGGG
jgi:hypothetical protein